MVPRRRRRGRGRPRTRAQARLACMVDVGGIGRPDTGLVWEGTRHSGMDRGRREEQGVRRDVDLGGHARSWHVAEEDYDAGPARTRLSSTARSPEHSMDRAVARSAAGRRVVDSRSGSPQTAGRSTHAARAWTLALAWGAAGSEDSDPVAAVETLPAAHDDHRCKSKAAAAVEAA